MENTENEATTTGFLRGTGAVLNTPDNRDIHIVAAVGAPTAHPKKRITDMSKFTHEDQLSWGTCVGQADGKGGEYRDFRETGVVTPLSKRFLYTQCKLQDGDTGQGTQPRIAARILKDKGIPKALLVPDNNALPYAQYLTVNVDSAILTDASTYRTSGFAFCYNLEDIKTAIDVAGVVNATMQCGNWDKSPLKPTPSRGYHRVLYFGYEDADNNGKDDTKIYVWNSWGNNWDDKGNGWFWYSDYANFIFDIMVYTDMPNEVIDYAKATNYKFTRDLQLQMSGVDVTELQKRLFKEKAKDGLPCYRYTSTQTPYYSTYFGTNTRDAVQRYQKVKGIANETTPGYGRVGPMTRAALNAGITDGKITLVQALIQVESGGNDYAVGDKHLVDRAYGCLQIRKPVCTDVNKALGTSYKPEDMLGNRQLSIIVFNAYMDLYATPQALGFAVTDEERARIWNGGPIGYKKSATLGYWEKVKVALNGAATGVPLSEQNVPLANRRERDED